MGSNMNYTYNGKEYEKVIFDVGANNGSSSVPLAIENPTYLVFAFEPTPEMIEVIKSKIVGLENYVIVPKAVSDYNGTAEFNVAGNWDWGCSSLLKFSRKSQTDWPGRTDFHVTYKLNVDVIRLDTFIEENGITKIDHLHIDTQGSDLNVMKGLGEYLHIVTEGKLEAGTSDDVLYEGQNKLNDCIKFLLLNGFKVVDVNSNDVFCHEVNVVFKK
jgi:FkbM family methyltransferase